MYVRGKRLQKGSTHSSGSALQQRRTDGRRHTRETTETGACDYTARSWKGRRNEKGGKFARFNERHKPRFYSQFRRRRLQDFVYLYRKHTKNLGRQFTSIFFLAEGKYI